MSKDEEITNLEYENTMLQSALFDAKDKIEELKNERLGILVEKYDLPPNIAYLLTEGDLPLKIVK